MGIKRREFLASVGGMAGLAVVPVAAMAQGLEKGGAAKGGAALYKQAGAPVDARVEDLLKRMTI